MEYKVGDRVRYVGTLHAKGEGIIIKYDYSPVPAYIEFDDGSKWWSNLTNLESIKKEETMEIPKVYKALVRTKDGRLVSIWAETLLDYHEGEVTYAPEGSMGIFIKTSSEGAKYSGTANSRRRCEELEGTLVVHEATPLGNLCSKVGHSTFLVDDRYPAILLGKEVWREEELRPEPKFKVGDRVKVVGGSYHRKEDFTVELIHWGADNPHFRGHAHWHYGFKTAGYYDPEGYFIDEGHLELAPPKEEWVDVTKECKLELIHASSGGDGGEYIQVKYGGQTKVCIGIGTPYVLGSAGDYKVEIASKDYLRTETPGMSTFRILKKVMK